MAESDLFHWAREFVGGNVGADEFLRAIREGILSDPLADVRIDLDRQRRCGYPEVVYGPGKAPETVVSIVETLLASGQPALVTRISRDQTAPLLTAFPQGIHNDTARTFRVGCTEDRLVRGGVVAIVTAGTSDRPVAEEASETLLWMGVRSRCIQDVGVAGPHRLRERLDDLTGCAAVIVVAGMEGALPSVVGGYVDCPVIGVPTSVGYGASLGGVSALLSMLNSCAANVAVVNIDAGFKAGYLAGMIARKMDSESGS